MKNILICGLGLLMAGAAYGQARQDKGVMKAASNPSFAKIKQSLAEFNAAKAQPEQKFMMDYTGVDVPKQMSEFKSVEATGPISQGATNTCWCFSTLSFFESEIFRMQKQQIRLSQSYIVYWEYVEKAREFVRTRGTSAFAEGSESNAVTRMMKQYGLLPYESYTGLKPNQPFYDHVSLYDELNKFLQSTKASGNWNEEAVLASVKSMLEYHMGTPPKTVNVAGKELTPLQYMNTVAKINPDDYVEVMSLLQSPYWTKAEYAVPDNWWHSADYYNVPLDVFMNTIKTAIKKGYSIAIGGDVSESGINSQLGVAMVPSYDIPSASIDDNARQFRFSNGSTTDDHGVHLIGYVEKPNGTWFLIKDSGSSSRNNPQNPGYYYWHEDFVKLKMMTFTVHKDMAKELLAKFPQK
jgi:bleomycin hydrolase